jgi:hypothetical protein
MSNQDDIDFGALQRQIGQEWLKYSIEKFQANIRKLKIGSTGELLRSFQGQVLADAGGDELKIRLAYALQGLFVDMGVGRRRQQEASPDARRLRGKGGRFVRQGGRHAKTWYGKQMGHERHRLAELLTEASGRLMLTSIATALPDGPVEINL